jgi:Ca2+/Na+ antiporter
LRWEGFISGTVGSLVATLPEFVVIAFLVRVEPLAAFVTTVVTIYNNALAFSVYSFFLPKDWRGEFRMPPSLTKAGAEVLIAGSGAAMIIGIIMLVLRADAVKTSLAGLDLVLIGAVLITIYAYYLRALVRYYAEGDEHDAPSHPPDPHELGHDTRWVSIASMFALGAAGSFFGGEAIGGFADTALNKLGLPAIATASGLAFFAGISEYIIVYKAHRRGELGIALSNVFGGMTQVLFLLVPFSMIVIAVLGAVTGSAAFAIPITTETILLMLLLFPLLYVLLQHMQEGRALSNSNAVAMTAVYTLLLYFLFTAPAARP